MNSLPPRSGRRLTERLALGIAAAFTLVEMLVVMAIILALLGLTLPLVRGVLGGRNVSDSLDGISGYLMYARTQAVTQNTYVIVGFYQKSGSDDLQMAGVVSANGTFNPGTFTQAGVVSPTANYPALGKTIHLSNVTLVPEQNLSQSLQAKVPVGATVVECSSSPGYQTNASYFSFTVGNNTFPYCVIIFSPQGEALFCPKGAANTTNFGATLPFYSQLFIGLRATRGGTVISTDVNSAAITIDGGSGDIKVYRL